MFVKNEDRIARFYVNICKDEKEIKNIKDYLKKYRGILDPRREVENERIRWFDLWWPREQSIFESEKIVTSRRAKENTFAFENIKTYPHHIHTKDANIVESELTGNVVEDLQKVLSEIKHILKEHHFSGH